MIFFIQNSSKILVNSDNKYVETYRENPDDEHQPTNQSADLRRH